LCSYGIALEHQLQTDLLIAGLNKQVRDGVTIFEKIDQYRRLQLLKITLPYQSIALNCSFKPARKKSPLQWVS
jgi:hypothetical protein